MFGGTRHANSGVYFYVHPGPYDPGYHHYAAHGLAQGLRRLGVPLFANFHAPGFTHCPFSATGESRQVVFCVSHLETWGQYAQSIAAFRGRRCILCMSDFTYQLVPPPGVHAFVAHESSMMVTRGDRSPWAFGYTDERLAQCGKPGDFSARRSVLIRDFRPSMVQGVRLSLDLALVPHLAKHFTIDRSIDESHFERLRSSIGCLCYGGEFAENLLRSRFFAEQQAVRDQLSVFEFRAEPAIFRWDSWRFWESLACGALSIHLDLEKYGCRLPVMPVAWQHYVPVDFGDLPGTVQRLMDEKPRWASIAAAGREWAMKHYSPDAVAVRFLNSMMAPNADRPVVVTRLGRGAVPTQANG